MKLLLTIILIFTIPFSVTATQQDPDILIYEGESYNLEPYSFPLEVYFATSGEKSPFKMCCAGNYRGYIATWELIDDTLYIIGINMNKINDLKKVFPNTEPGEKIKAVWFSGYLCVKTDRHKKKYTDGSYSYEYKNFIYFNFMNGKMKEKKIVTNKDYRKSDEPAEPMVQFENHPKPMNPYLITVSMVMDWAKKDLDLAWGPLNSAKWTEKEVPELLEALKSANNNVRWCASYALRFIKITKYVDEIYEATLKGIDDNDYRVRSACLELMAEYKLETEEFLINRVKKDTSNIVREKESYIKFLYKGGLQISTHEIPFKSAIPGE